MRTDRRTHVVTILLTAIVILAAVVRFRGLAFGLPYTQARPDETFIIGTALTFLKGNFYPQFYDYPWLSIWVVVLLYVGYYVWGAATGSFHTLADMVASWPIHWEPFFLLVRAASAIAGTATVIALFRIGSKLWDAATGLVAALFLSLALLHVRDSHFATTDIAMTFLIVVSVGLLMDAERTGSLGTFAWFGAVSGLAAATKYNAVLLVVPAIVSVVLHGLEASGRPRLSEGVRRFLAFSVPFLLAFAIGIPFVVLDTNRFLAAMGELVNSMRVGTPHLDLSSGWLYHLEWSLRYGLGLPLLVAGLAGTAAMLVLEPKTGALLLSFPIAYYIVAGSIRNLFFRYAIPMVPFLCLTAAWLLVRIAKAVTTRWLNDEARARPLVTSLSVAAVAIAIVWPSAANTWGFDRVMSQRDNRVIVAEWFARYVPAGSSILQSGSRYGQVQFDDRLHYVSWVWKEPPGIFLVDGSPATGQPDWILLQESPLPSETQPIVKEFLKEGYARVQVFHALELNDSLVFDPQDAFFVPLAGFRSVVRPGPNFSAYARTASLRDELRSDAR